jgi:predicted RecB family nuclease
MQKIKQIYDKCIGNKERTKFTIAGSKLGTFTMCPTKLYMDYFGPQEKKLPTHEFLLKKIEDGKIHEEDVCSEYQLTPVVFDTLEQGFKETIKSMFKGVKLMRNHILFYLPEDLMGIPDLLERDNSHNSIFGNYHYVVSDIKLATHPRPEHVMQIIFYSYLLGKIQGYTPKYTYLVLGDKTKQKYKVSEYLPVLEKGIIAMRETLAGKEPNPTLIPFCPLCPWKTHCLDICVKTDEISLIAGLGKSKKLALVKQGIKTVQDLMDSPTENLISIKGIGQKTVDKWKLQAKSLKENKEIILEEPIFPEKKTEIYLDFESADEVDVEYLIGLLIVEGKKDDIKQFVAKKPEDELTIWKQFLELLDSKEEFTIYHYASYEKRALNKLAEKYGIEADQYDKLFNNLIDLYPIVTKSVVLPIYSYSLKPLAKYLGFKWRDSKADAAQSMYWYDLWLKEKDEKYLKWSCEYNEDDLFATKEVKFFLANSTKAPERIGKVDKSIIVETPEIATQSHEEIDGIRIDSKNKFVLYNLQNGIFDSKRFYDLHKKAVEISLIDNFERLIALDNVKVSLFPHQVDTAYTVVNKLKLSALLADEVGLGKTIEAGMIIKELICRGLIKKILILVPASLTTQWQEELKVKFNEEFVRSDEFKTNDFWSREEKIIASIDTAKQLKNASIIKEINWDLILIDEAHKLKNEETLNYQFVEKIPKKYFFMLTATPMQNNLKELYNMFSLLKPGLLGTLNQFNTKFVEDTRTAKNHEELQGLLAEIMIRNRRNDIDIKFPDRIVPNPVAFELSKEEMDLYNELEKFIRAHYSAGVALVLMILQRVATSSTFAITSTLARMIKSQTEKKPYKLEEGEYEENVVELEKELRKVKFDVDWLKRLHKQAASIKENTKGNELLKYVNKYLKDDKILIFTSFRKTQEYIFKILSKAGYKSAIFNGSMNWAEKDKAVEDFKGDAQILISTEAGGEGRNLQFCHVMINYDLPWNPMRIEQRIGRVHRLKQEHDVLIINFSSKDTIEEYILELLYKKIKLFEVVIGELDTILSNVVGTPDSFEKTIMQIVVKSKDKREMKDKFGKLALDVDKGKKVYEKVKGFDGKVFENFDLTPMYKYEAEK